MPNFTEKDVHALIIMYKVVVEGNTSFLTQTIRTSSWNQLTVDIRQFCIFLFLQNYKNHSESGKKELTNSWGQNQFNESIRSNNRLLSQSFSPINSPRTKMARNGQPIEQSSQILNFLKNNMKVILKILSGNMDSRVNDNDFILLNSDVN